METKEYKLTKQGVRDLNSPKAKGESKEKFYYGPFHQCDHRRFKADGFYKGKPHGHWYCPDCGMNLDDFAGC